MTLRRKALLVISFLLLATSSWGAAQDYTTFTEVDEDTTITVATSNIDLNAMPNRDDTSYVYKDMTSIGDFTGEVEFDLTTMSNYKWNTAIYGASDQTDDISGWTSGFSLVQHNNNSSVVQDFRIYSATTYLDGTGDLNNATRFFSVDRSTTTWTVYIYTDSARETLEDTIAGTISADSVQYLYALSTWDNNTAGRTVTADIDNMDYTPSAPAGRTRRFF